ncbi:methyltransferase [Dictyobacter sp. S3.2.2.5]|uniref:Methyltransferase n=1 Tax=Dictyobacter halimunensis TaxID=3026934 RepID=A0ABQ6FM05_9CHLR|nr:methyltransferase [Dictyobacter sp. S3.2.2.5]
MNESHANPKARVADFYSRVATTYDEIGPAVFATFGQRVIERAAIPPGARVLDIAAGKGANLFAAAEKVGPTGQVIGIDIAPAMVQQVQESIRLRGLTQAAMQLMDAEQLTFADASFDYVLCNFAIFFFPHLQQALTEFLRVLRPGGTFAVTLPGGGDPRWRWYNEMIGTYYQQEQIDLPPLLANAQPLPDLGSFTQLMGQIGFTSVHHSVEEAEFVYASEQEWWEARWTHGERYPLENMPPLMLERFKAEVFKRMAALKQSDGYHEKWRIYCVLAHR